MFFFIESCHYYSYWVWRLTCPAVASHPALQANLRPGLLAPVVSEIVVAGDAELVAFVAVVVVVAAHPDAVGESGDGPLVRDGLPVVSGVDHTGVNAALY